MTTTDTTTVTLCRGWDGTPILTVALKVHEDTRPSFRGSRFVHLPGIATNSGYRNVHTHGDIERAFVDDEEAEIVRKWAARYR